MRREEEEVKTFVGKEFATSFIQLMAKAFFHGVCRWTVNKCIQ